MSPATSPLRRALVAAAAACALPLGSCGSRSHGPPPNVVIWLVDTLRADHLSCYGYARPTSPHIDALAQNGVLFEQVHSHSNWTQPSVTALVTGSFPPPFSGRFKDRVPEAMTLVSEWLTAQGYRAVGRTVTGATAAQFGFAQGYEEYVELDGALSMSDRKRRDADVYLAENLVDSTLDWLAAPAALEKPFFLMLHTVDPHEPYTRHPEVATFAGEQPTDMDGSIDRLRERKAANLPFTRGEQRFIIDMYDEEIAYNDQQLGRLVAALEERGLLDNTLLVVVSDHGEELFERDEIGHGHHNLHSELTHIPFVLHWPAGLPRGLRVGELVREVDLMPTLLDLIGAAPFPDADGQSLSWLVRGEAPGVPYLPRVELDRGKSRQDLKGIRTAEHLFVHDPIERIDAAGGNSALYGLALDPSERKNLLPGGADQARSLMQYLEGWRNFRDRRVRGYGSQKQKALDEETQQRLEQLGYLGDDEDEEREPDEDPQQQSSDDG